MASNGTLASRTRSALLAADMASRRRRLGAFYTPGNVAETMARWAIRTSQDSVLDPSCGGCAFLEAAIRRLHELGTPHPERHVFGVDVDPRALRVIRELTAGREAQFRHKDFLAVETDSFGRLFQTILGNPPYLRPTSLSAAARNRVRKRMSELAVPIGGRASLWAPFVAYATSFLAEGGRIAMVLPSALVHAEYGDSLLTWLSFRFASVHLDVVKERLFEGTHESSVLLFADGYGGKTVGVSLRRLDSVSSPPLRSDPVARSERASTLRVTPETRDRYESVCQGEKVVRLGELVSISIGIVTGANDFFVISEEQRRQFGFRSKYCKPLIRRPDDAPGLSVEYRDLAMQREAHRAEHLLVVPAGVGSSEPSLKRWMRRGYAASIPQRHHCRIRDAWYAVKTSQNPPNAFLCPMGRNGPRLIVNQSAVWCTNNIFALNARPGAGAPDWDALSLGLLSSFSQLSAELNGRAYGGGILKLEPSEAARVLVPVLPSDRVDKIRARVDSLMRSKQIAVARELVDSELESAGIVPNPSWNASFRLAMQQLRSARQPTRGDRGDAAAKGWRA